MHLGTVASSLLVTALSVFAAEHGPQQDANAHCAQRLRLPAYPGIAVSARLSGDISATVLIGRAGVVRDVAFGGKPHLLLANAVLDAIRASTFVSTCEERNVTLSFKFLIEGQGTDYPTPPVVSFGFPNTFWIVSAPRNPQPYGSFREPRFLPASASPRVKPMASGRRAASCRRHARVHATSNAASAGAFGCLSPCATLGPVKSAGR